MERGVKRVADKEKGREKERVEKWGLAMARGGKGIGSKGQEARKRQEHKKVRTLFYF